MPKDADNFGLNRDALEGALEALAVGPEHAPLVESCRSLADVVDGPKFIDAAWREYRLALVNLMEATAHVGSDKYDKFLESIRAAVGDSSEPG